MAWLHGVLAALSLAELRQFSPLVGADVFGLRKNLRRLVAQIQANFLGGPSPTATVVPSLLDAVAQYQRTGEPQTDFAPIDSVSVPGWLSPRESTWLFSSSPYLGER